MVGEAGPEAVIPLKGIAASRQGIAPLANNPSLSGSGGGRAATGVGGLQVGSINITAPNMTNAQVVKELYLSLRPMLQGA